MKYDSVLVNKITQRISDGFGCYTSSETLHIVSKWFTPWMDWKIIGDKIDPSWAGVSVFTYVLLRVRCDKPGVLLDV